MATKKAEVTDTTVKFTLDTVLTHLTVGDFINALRTVFVQEQAQSVGQIAQVTKETIAQAVGELQSDLASRGVIKYDEDIGQAERLRQLMSRSAAAWDYKGNVTDFVAGLNAVGHQGTGQNALDRMVEASLNHYNTTLTDERIQKSRRIEQADASTQAKDKSVLDSMNES